MRYPPLSILPALMLTLAACTAPEPGRTAPYSTKQQEVEETLFQPCDEQPVQYALGQKADAATGALIVKEAHARFLRWLPPRSSATADYRPDRINVEYDDAYIITRIRCG